MLMLVKMALHFCAAAKDEAEPELITVFDFGLHPFREILNTVDAPLVEEDAGRFKRFA
jgi:hypothetical protein